jgi:hypothetical protein
LRSGGSESKMGRRAEMEKAIQWHSETKVHLCEEEAAISIGKEGKRERWMEMKARRRGTHRPCGLGHMGKKTGGAGFGQ